MANAVDVAVLPCLRCNRRFGKRDVEVGAFYASTMICGDCYRKGQQSPLAVWCFGKVDAKRGYNPDARECSSECPDREICKEFIQIREETMAKDKKHKKKEHEEPSDESIEEASAEVDESQ